MNYKELIDIRDNLNMNSPIEEKVYSHSAPVENDWQAEYWNNIGALLGLGAYMFIWGLIFAILVAGAFLILGAILLWSVALLMAIMYPILVGFSWFFSLFRRN